MSKQVVTWDSGNKYSSTTLSNNNLSTSTISTAGGVRSTIGKSSGKWYLELTSPSNGTFSIGIIDSTINLNTNVGALSTKQQIRGYSPSSKKKYPENLTYGATPAANDTYSILLDLDNGTLEFYKNGVSMGISHTNLSSLFFPVYVFAGNLEGWGGGPHVITANFGATPFKYSIPDGFSSYGLEFVHKILISSEDEYYSVIPEVIATETAIPQMTSNTAPSGRAFASSVNSTTYDAWKAFDKTDTGFLSANGTGGIGYLGYEFISLIQISRYVVRSPSGNTNVVRLPKDWSFEGSNDGVSWIILDTQVNQTWTTENTDKEYVIDTSKINSCKMYRLNWTANGGATAYSSIGELLMYEDTIGKLFRLPNQSEQTFINHGMNKDTSIDLTTSKILERRYIVQDNAELGSGKVFKQKIDTDKIPIKNAMIE